MNSPLTLTKWIDNYMIQLALLERVVAALDTAGQEIQHRAIR